MNNKYYIVAITKTRYRVVFASYDLPDLINVLSDFVKSGYLNSCGLVVRYGSTGERHCIATYLKPWTHEIKPEFGHE